MSARVAGVMDYDEIWERFVRERRLEFGGHTDPAWREGHSLSASLVIPIEASRIRERCGLRKPSGPPHLTLAYFHAPDGSPAPEELISTVARYRDWPVGELAVETVEVTFLDLRLEYPEPKVLAEIPLKSQV